jgi:hypothetical protein
LAADFIVFIGISSKTSAPDGNWNGYGSTSISHFLSGASASKKRLNFLLSFFQTGV